MGGGSPDNSAVDEEKREYQETRQNEIAERQKLAHEEMETIQGSYNQGGGLIE